MFRYLQGKKATKNGVTLSNLIQCGVELPGASVGVSVGDEDAWTKFKDLLEQMVSNIHKFDPEHSAQPAPTMDASKIKFTDKMASMIERYAKHTVISAVRNVKGFPMPCAATSQQRADLEGKLRSAFDKLGEGDPELGGTYRSIADLSAKDSKDLEAEGGAGLFTKPAERDRKMEPDVLIKLT